MCVLCVAIVDSIFFCFRFTSIVLLSLDTIQHIESLSLLFNNNYYLSFIIIILKLSKDSLRGRSVVFHLSFIICFLPSFASLRFFILLCLLLRVRRFFFCFFVCSLYLSLCVCFSVLLFFLNRFTLFFLFNS